MSISPDEAVLDHLDFHYQQPCEHGAHLRQHIPEDPARFLVRATCPGCSKSGERFVCLSGWERAGQKPIRHRACGWIGPRDATWLILRVIGTT